MPTKWNALRDVTINLIATALYILIGILLSYLLGFSEQLGIVLVAIFVLVFSSLLLVLFSTNMLARIERPWSTLVLSVLILSILLNTYFIFNSINMGKTIPIQSLNPFVFSYGGDYDDKATTWGTSRFAADFLSGNNITYTIDYSLPKDKSDVWAGMSFKFDNKQNLKLYKSLEADIFFGNPDPQRGEDSQADCNLVFYDGKNKAIVNLRKANGTGTQNRRRITIDLERDVQGVDLTSITEIAFDTNNEFPRGDHTLTISDIRLMKP